MARSIIILLMLVGIRAECQSFMLNDIFPTNKGVAQAIPVQAPITQSQYWFVPGTWFLGGHVTATDPQGLQISYNESKNWSQAQFSEGPGNGIGINGFQYQANNGFFGTDSNVWYANNGTISATNLIFVTSYQASLGYSICGVPCNENSCNFIAPNLSLSGNYFFTIYSQSSPCVFSNLYYVTSSPLGIFQVNLPNSYPTPSLGGFGGMIVFPNACANITMCMAIINSNPPCTMVAPTNFGLVVVTNSSNTFSLQGSTPAYVISTQPTNGYLTNLNGTTGLVTYVETNNSATADFFTYCTSNSTVCQLCANCSITIGTSITCGNCYNAPRVNGGVVTGDIWINTGITNETVCIYYTNLACHLTTNCTQTDIFGNARFFPVNFGCGSSNYCIANISGGCTNLCYFGHVSVTATGVSPTPPYGDYYLSSITIDTNTLVITETLTNSQDNTGGTYFVYQSDGLFAGSTAYCQGQVQPLSSYCSIQGVYVYTGQQFFGNGQTPVFNADCTSHFPGNIIGGWQCVCPCFTVPDNVVFDTVLSIPICTQTCP